MRLPSADVDGVPPGCRGFTGAWFERLADPGPDDAFRLTGADLGALSALAVEVPAAVAIRLLQQHRPRIEELLARIPADIAIWDADDADIGPHGAAEELWALKLGHIDISQSGALAPAGGDLVLHTRALVKGFGDRVRFDGLGLGVATGSVYGLLAPMAPAAPPRYE